MCHEALSHAPNEVVDGKEASGFVMFIGDRSWGSRRGFLPWGPCETDAIAISEVSNG